MKFFKVIFPLVGISFSILLSAFSTDPAPIIKKERTVKFIAPRGDCVDVYVRWRNGQELTSFTIRDSEEHTVTLDDNGDYQYRAKLCSGKWCPKGIYTSVPFYTDEINVSSYDMCY